MEAKLEEHKPQQECPGYGDPTLLTAGYGRRHPPRLLFTAAMSSSMVTAPLPSASSAGHAVTEIVPRVMFTPLTSSSTVTAPFPLQSPTHGAGVGLGVSVRVAVALRDGVVVAVRVTPAVALAVALDVGVSLGVGVGLAVEVDGTLGVGLGVPTDAGVNVAHRPAPGVPEARQTASGTAVALGPQPPCCGGPHAGNPPPR
ncbi:MAG: hypothetical protein ACE5I7_05555 [Candidatus Binatia bacterium]